MDSSVPLTGLLPVLKPPGMTSHDVVGRVRRLLGTRRIGHTGTLDPGVAGVLLLLVGRGTRLAELLQAEDKTYVAEMFLGTATDTQDGFGRVTNVTREMTLNGERLRSVMARFVGPLAQIPPMTSAIRQGGRRLYELAQKGLEVERPPRPVVIHRMHITRIDARPVDGDATGSYLGFGTRVTFVVECSKGTYVRTLCHDIGEALGCGAFMSFLLRTRVGDISLGQARTLDELAAEAARGTVRLFPLDLALQHVPSARVDDRVARRVRHGSGVSTGDFVQGPTIARKTEQERPGADLLRLYDGDGTLLALMRPDPQGPGAWRPRIVFPDE